MSPCPPQFGRLVEADPALVAGPAGISFLREGVFELWRSEPG